MDKTKQTGDRNILERIVSGRREYVETLKGDVKLKEFKGRISDMEKPRGFIRALNSGREINIIAEVKGGSPSAGIIRNDLDPGGLAAVFEENGAAAVSVLTEPEFFGGSDRFIIDAKERTKIPVLRKDFIIDPFQVYETRALGADALLLIVAALDPALLRELKETANELGLDCLVEVHDADEVETALTEGAELIGINNRDLKTFTTDLNTSINLSKMIPEEKTVVSASGINGFDDIFFLMRSGIRSFLVGESLMRAKNVGGKMRELLGLG
ncbi:MAG: indole-3-glycerol phosphate synthase TrpC [Deltaproteobacteria bacterium]|uniref:Indole-3-glycerol phosphate synthase n=1 Tax=Candidatus Zymogenus saltonus TaxID=2844893 RepID=A0A9D8KHL0_9DELT|nr:indole-3-glycerol phosphate synthase TrpC [Candidatus Zymogenus saltonus]